MAAEVARTKACIAHQLEYGRHSPALAHVEAWCQLESLPSNRARPVTEELLMAAFAEIYDEAVRLYGGEAGGVRGVGGSTNQHCVFITSESIASLLLSCIRTSQLNTATYTRPFAALFCDYPSHRQRRNNTAKL